MSRLQIIENDLVPVYETGEGVKIVDGRELYHVLQSKQEFSNWVKKRLSECDAVKDEDYELIDKIIEQVSGAKHRTEYLIKLDTAKEMAMLERNEKGKQVRKYFIEVERKYKEKSIDRSQLSPEIQALYGLLDNQAKLELEQRRQQEEISRIDTTVSTMKEIFTQPIGDWKAEINARVREVAHKSGIEYQELYNRMYGELETTAHCSLKRLQENKKARMEKAGNTKTAIKEGTTKIAIIFEKPQLKAIFETIVRQYAMRYCA